MGDDIGKANFNYKVQKIGPFVYKVAGMEFTVSSDERMTFVLTVRNIGHTDGLSVSAPDFVNTDSNIHSRDWSATFNHDGTHYDLALT